MSGILPFFAIPFLELADNLVEAPFDLLQVILDKLALLLFQFAFELHPFPFELIGIHGFLLLREIAPSSTILSLLTIMARRPGSGLVKIDQIARLRRAYSYLDAFLHLTEEAF
ncbi:MAG TPA: hypothetical protein VGQ79_05270, partial [Nitrospiraceae bacterium]|nr:hypothetical protein [Nitrospiraceae bacterium]